MHAGFIDALGGTAAVADWLTKSVGAPVEYESVKKWRQNGVGWRWRFRVAEMAAERRVPLPVGFFDPIPLPKTTSARTPAAAGRLEQPRENAAAEGGGQGHRGRNRS